MVAFTNEVYNNSHVHIRLKLLCIERYLLPETFENHDESAVLDKFSVYKVGNLYSSLFPVFLAPD